MPYIIYNGELYHHGVKGMKWGVRRYQNKDGTLTEAGKRRQLKQDYRADKKTRSKLTRQANETGRWLRTYNKTVDKELVKVSDKIKKEERKGVNSKKTVTRARGIPLLLRDQQRAAKANTLAVKELETHVKNMMDKYGSKKVKDIKYDRDSTEGEKYVSTTLNNDGMNYSLIRRKASDSSGTEFYVYEPVKTRMYVY